MQGEDGGYKMNSILLMLGFSKSNQKLSVFTSVISIVVISIVVVIVVVVVLDY